MNRKLLAGLSIVFSILLISAGISPVSADSKDAGMTVDYTYSTTTELDDIVDAGLNSNSGDISISGDTVTLSASSSGSTVTAVAGEFPSSSVPGFEPGTTATVDLTQVSNSATIEVWDDAGASIETKTVSSAGEYELGDGSSTIWSVDVSVPNSGDTAEINSYTTSSDATGGVSGTVTDSDGNTIGDVTVEVSDSAGNVVATVPTASDGSYSVTGLADDEYSVAFKDSEYVTNSEITTVSGGSSEVADVALSVVTAKGQGVASPVSSDRPLVLSPSVDTGNVAHTDGNAEFIVTVDPAKVDSFNSWVADSDSRVIQEEFNAANKFVVSAPAGDVISPQFFGDALMDRAYITGLSYNYDVSLVSPVEELEGESSLDAGTLQKVTAWGEGSWNTDGVAFDDVQTTTLSDVRTTYGSNNVAETGSGTKIAILDTGANYNQDLYGSRITDGYNFVDETSIDKSAGDYSAIADGNGHGSWVTTAAAGNGSTSAGVGMAPGADIAVGKVLADDGSGETDDIVDGLEWACGDTVDADVVSMSLGSPVHNAEIASAVDNCVESGTTVVAATGNSRTNPATMYVSSPADHQSEGMIAVSATTTANADNAESAYFSEVGPARGIDSGGATRGSMPTVGAAGMEITATVADESGTQYDSTLSGTSMSTPIVSGSIAVAMEADASLQDDPSAVKTRIEETAHPAANMGETEVGNGIINVESMATNTASSTTQEEVRDDAAISRDKAHRGWAGRPSTVDRIISLFD